MKCLTLWEPWAAAIALGWKLVENRPWATAHRGILAISAAKRWYTEKDVEDIVAMRMMNLSLMSTEGYAAARDQCRQALLNAMRPGHITSVVNVERVVSDASMLSEHQKVWMQPGKKGFVLSDFRMLRVPVPVRGMQAMFDLDEHVAALVRAQVSPS